ncbi:MAG TPA: M57 family metalloprotease, partial [Chitinophagaceae bacterium]|nr:M57 family metalloprotease [Chitinophagaceae bacterium]
ITVSVSSRLPSSYVAATDEAISRYNALGLLITFQRVSSGGNIDLVKAGGNFLASSGFPSSGGAPYPQVKINTNQLSGQPQATVASVIAHEIGHCIGFRHTDYMNRAYSCGGSAVNEGASTVGAVLIPGTPSGPDPNSWMLSCIGSGQNRPFNANDKVALGYLY